MVFLSFWLCLYLIPPGNVSYSDARLSLQVFNFLFEVSCRVGQGESVHYS